MNKQNRPHEHRKQRLFLAGGIGVGLLGLFAFALFVFPTICPSCVTWIGLPPTSTSRQAQATTSVDNRKAVPIGTGVSDQAPDFALTDIDGNKIALSDLRGRPVVLYFSAAWCLPCAPETQELAKRKARYGALKIVWISVDPNTDSPESLRKHRRQYARDDFIYALDTIGLARLYRVVSLGDLYLLDAQGRIVFKGTRPVGTKPFEEALKQLGD